MREKRIRAVFHWIGIVVAGLIVVVTTWVFTAAAVYGVMRGIGWMIARFMGDREQISN